MKGDRKKGQVGKSKKRFCYLCSAQIGKEAKFCSKKCADAYEQRFGEKKSEDLRQRTDRDTDEVTRLKTEVAKLQAKVLEQREWIERKLSSDYMMVSIKFIPLETARLVKDQIDGKIDITPLGEDFKMRKFATKPIVKDGQKKEVV